MSKQKNCIVIGGSTGIGFEVAKLSLEDGLKVIIASRSEQKLSSAKERLNNQVEIEAVDMRDEKSLDCLFSKFGKVDHLVVTASDIEFGPVAELSLDKAKASFDSKFWGPYTAVKAAIPYLSDDASVTLFSGGFSQRPQPGAAVIAAINCAIEGLCRALSLELAPIRINVVAPGLTDTEHFDHFSDNEKSKFFNAFCNKLPIKRPAQAHEIAQAAIYLIKNTYSTGATVYVDGGYTV